jgi:hypothetical protein
LRVEGFTFYFTSKECADPGSGKPESDVVNEVRREHESVAEDMADIRRINNRTVRRCTPASLPVPIVK